MRLRRYGVKLEFSVVDPEIFDTRIFRATFIVFRITSKPNRGVGVLAQFADHVLLAVVEGVTQNNRMIPARTVILYAPTGRCNGFESPFAVRELPHWRGRRRDTHDCRSAIRILVNIVAQKVQ